VATLTHCRSLISVPNMAHHYTTRALILARRPRGEGNVAISLFTRDFGLIYPIARSARSGSSKLRGMLQNGFVGEVTLVRGARSWKIVGAIEEKNILFDLKKHPNSQKLVARVISLVERLVKGEDKNDRLFDVVMNFFSYVGNHSLALDQLEVLERLTALKILATLGYGSLLPEFQTYLESDTIDAKDLELLRPHQKIATREINKALEAAQL
jgi:DNA repair protein RecO